MAKDKLEIKDLLSKRRNAHDANQLLIDIMDRWGGTPAFADALYVEFQAARPGSLIRQNLLEMIQKLVVNNTNHNITRIIDPSDLDDEEIDAEIQSAIERARAYRDERRQPCPQTVTSAWQEEAGPL